MKKNRIKKLFLEQLGKIPIVQVSCEKVSVSRNTVYRWRKEDPEFSKSMDEALAAGEAIVNDMSESQLLSKIKNGEWPPISFWLRKRHPKFKDRLEITGTLQGPQEELSPEEEMIVKEALRLASPSVELPQENSVKETEVTPPEEIINHNEQNHEQKQ